MNRFMKKSVLIFMCVLMGTSVFAATFKKGSTVYVSVKKTTIKNSNGNFAKDVANVTYGDQLKIVSVSGNKVQVQLASNSKTVGWIASNSITTKKIVKNSSGGSVSASTKELALAGKGFSEETESIYREASSDLDFSKVDKIESASVSDAELLKFITDGHLSGGTK